MIELKSILFRTDEVLRGDARSSLSRARSVRGLSTLLCLLLVFGLTYGAVMGCYGGMGGGQWRQILYSAIKVPMLLVVTFGLSVPSLFVLSNLLGLRDDFRETLAAIISTQAGLTIILAALAPFTAFWYVSVRDYQLAILFNGVIFAIATFSAQSVLNRRYHPLIVSHPRHRMMLRVWLATYCFVGIQMGWVLRPFIGNPLQPISFFRSGAWGNAYVYLIELVWNALSK